MRNSGRYVGVLLILYLGAAQAKLGAQVRVDIRTPGIVGLAPGTAQALGLMLEAQVELADREIESVIASALEKPLLLDAFAEALPLSLLPLSPMPAWNGRRFTLAFSAGGSSQADSYDLELWRQRVDSLKAESDYRAGLGLQPLSCRLSIDLSPLVPGLAVTGLGSYLDYESEAGLGLGSWEAGLGLSWLALRPRAPGRYLSWNGLSLEAAFGLAGNRLAADLDLGKVTKTISFSPSPYLPLSYNVELEVEPTVRISFDTSALVLPFQLSTGLRFLDALSVSVGAGGYWARGSSSIGLEGEEPVDLSSDSSLGESFLDPAAPATITLSGSSEGRIVSGWSGYVFCAIELRSGAVYFQLPLLAYDLADGFSAALGLGISL